MPNSKEKLAHFEKAIFAEVDEKAAAILDEAEQNRKELLLKAGEEARAQAEKEAKEELKQMEVQSAQIVTKEKLNAKQEILLKRKELVNGLFEKVGEHLKEFSKTGEYETYLSAVLQRNPLSDGKILARPEDCPLVEKLAPRCKVEPDTANLLGGVILISLENNIYIDETFAAKLHAKQEGFYSENSIQLDIL